MHGFLVFCLATAIAEAPTAAPPAVTSARQLSLSQALVNADEHQPQIRQAAANTLAARARVMESRGPLLPQVQGTAALIGTNYFGGNNGSSIGVGVGGSATGVGAGAGPGSSGGGAYLNSAGGWRTTLGLTASELLWDFGQTWNRARSFQASADQFQLTEEELRVVTHQAVRAAYYNAHALRALLGVAQDTLENQRKHVQQTEAQIRVGTQPEIALATARATFFSDSYQLIQAQGSYSTGKAQLNQAMGVEGSLDYDVNDHDAPLVPGEDASTEDLLAEALKARPAYRAMERQVDAQSLLVSSYKGSYWPQLSAEGGVFATATRPTNLAGDVFGELVLNWTLFNGLTNVGNVREQKANLLALEAQRDELRQQIRLDLETARLAVLTAKSGLESTAQAVLNAHEQLRLAEGRFAAGVGNIIELSDAQLTYTAAEVQQVQAEYNLNNARATLLAKLGQG